MDSNGGFYEVEKDGKLFQLVYHHPKYNPIPQTQSSTASGEPANHYPPHKPLFLCPYSRFNNYGYNGPSALNCPPEYDLATARFQQDETSIDIYKVDHHVLPFFWCNNKKFEVDGGCYACGGLDFGTDYYFCESHDIKYHKECVESPLKIKHPSHPEHFLQLFYYRIKGGIILECFCCGGRGEYLVYYCTICQIVMHPICAMKTINFVIDQPKRHDHPLTFFPRQTSLTCNICGSLRKMYHTYVCLRCNFVAHEDCMYFPHIIRISRHHHRVSYVSSLQSAELSCGVCRQSICGNYGAYICHKCGDYAVHPRCALRKDVCDGIEVEGVPEEDDLSQDAAPFEMISEGVILHFLHDHHLKLEVNILYDENKLCQGCVLPIFEDTYYSCMECEVFLHEKCVTARRRIQHELHPHPLILRDANEFDSSVFYKCDACWRVCGGFVYQCPIKECYFGVDMRCASISEPFDYQGHEHPLFLSLDPEEKPTCQVCKSECLKQLNCLKCDFIVCFKCATLPYNVRYKHDKHILTILWGEKVCEKDWCELCERNLKDTSTIFIYWCKDCCTTLHVACLLGEDLYTKPGQYFAFEGKELQILGKSNLARPFCDFCKYPCQGNIFSIDNRIMCSFRCVDLKYDLVFTSCLISSFVELGL